MTKKLRYASLFSGIESPLQAAFRVYGKENVEHIFSCEWDKFARQSCNAIYDMDAKHFHEDVNDLDATPYKGKVDILVGGSPCQDFSVAGKGAGFDGLRGSLTGQFVRVLAEVMPPQFIFENVPGITGPKFKNGLKIFIQKLREIGYHLHVENANTKHYGVPQSRDRFWIVGFLDASMYSRFEFAKKIPLEKRLKDILEDDVDAKYYLSQKMLNGFKSHSKTSIEHGETKIKTIGNTNPCGHGQSGEVFLDTAIAPTLTTNKGEGIKIAGLLDMKGSDQIKRVYEEGGVSPCLTTMQGGQQEPKIIQRIFPEAVICASRGRNIDNPNSRVVGDKVEQKLEVNKSGASNTITTVQKDNYVMVPSTTVRGYEVAHDGDSINLSMPKSKTRRGRVGDKVANTLDTQCNQGVLFMDGFWWWVRKLTPLECWRLQDFPDEAYNKAVQSGVSPSQLYKQAGNSMSVNVLEMIFTQIEKSKIEGGQNDRLF